MFPYADTPFTRFLRARREDLDLSPGDLATALGYEKPNTVAMYERGEVKFPHDRLIKLADRFDLHVADVLLPWLQAYWPDVLDWVEIKPKAVAPVRINLPSPPKRPLL